MELDIFQYYLVITKFMKLIKEEWKLVQLDQDPAGKNKRLYGIIISAPYKIEDFLENVHIFLDKETFPLFLGFRFALFCIVLNLTPDNAGYIFETEAPMKNKPCQDYCQESGVGRPPKILNNSDILGYIKCWLP